MRHRPACLLLLVWVAVGCAGVKAQSDFDPNARFDTYKSFAWVGEQPGMLPGDSGDKQKSIDPLLARRIQGAIESYLEAKGYQKVEDLQAADFAVAFNVGRQEKIQVQSYPTAGGYYGYGGWYAGSSVSARSYTEGTLNIDIFDGKSHLAVWHGSASKRVDEKMDRAALVDEVVSAILEKFPPPR